MIRLTLTIAAFTTLTATVCNAEISCESVGQAAKNIYTGIYQAQLGLRIEEGRALTRAFWFVNEIAPECPGLQKYAQALTEKKLSKGAESKSFENVFCPGGVCAGPSSKSPFPTGGVEGYVIDKGDRVFIVPSLDKKGGGSGARMERGF